MNEPTKYEAAVAQMLLENKHWVDVIDEQEKANHDEWEWQMKIDKIEQNHDFLREREQEEKA
jgi:hypothetical protein